MGMQKIKFNVDYGINFTEKNIEKELSKQYKGIEDQLQKAIDNGDKISVSIDVDNAVDLNGNPIDQKSLKEFTKKYEKTMNTALNKMISEFRDNMSNQISDVVSENLKGELNKLFSEMGQNIVDGIINMKNEIMSSLSGNQIVINPADMVKVDTTSTTDATNKIEKNADNVVKAIENSSKKIEKANKKTHGGIRTNQDFVNAIYEITAEVAVAEREYNKAKASYESALNEEIVIKRNLENDKKKNKNITFNNKYIEEIKASEEKLKETIKTLINIYDSNYEEINRIDTDIDDISDKLQEKYGKLETNMSQIVEIIKKIGLTRNDIEKIIGTGSDSLNDIFYSIDFDEGSVDAKTQKDNSELEKLKTILSAREKTLEEARKQLSNLQSQQEKMAKNFPDDSKVQEVITKEGKRQYKSAMTVHPVLNMDKFITDTINSIESIKETIAEHPVEVPVIADQESIGELVLDLANSIADGMERHKTQLVLDTDDFISQIQNATKGINIDINGNLSSVFVDENTAISSQLIQNSELQFQAQEISDEISTSEENIENINQELDKTIGKLEKAKKVANELVGEIELEDSDEIEYQNKVKAYSRFKDLTYKKGIPKSLEEKELQKEDNRTSEEESRLNELKEERKVRQQIREEWFTLSPAIERVNNAQEAYDSNKAKLDELEKLRNKKNSGKDLIWIDQQTFEVLSKEEEQRKKNLEKQKQELDLAKQELVLAKQNSPFWGTIQDSVLKKVNKDLNDISIQKKEESKEDYKKRRNRTINKLTNLKNINQTESVIGSVEYDKKYKQSIKNINLDNNLKKLENQAHQWDEIIELVDKYGSKKAALESVQEEIAKIDRQLRSNKEGLNTAEERFSKGIYTPQRMAEIKSSAESEKKILNQQKESLKKKRDSLRETSEEELSIEIERNKQKQKLIKKNKYQEAEKYKSVYEIAVDNYKKEISTEEGKNKELNRLRYEDLVSLEKYVDKKNLLHDLKERKKSYDKQLAAEKERLISEEGLSENNAENQKWKILGNNKYPDKSFIDKLETEISNLELDLNEILALVQDINILQDRLADGNISTDEISDIKTQLSRKRSSLETIISRTGWDDRGYQQYLNLKSDNKDTSFDFSEKAIDINKFKKDATSVQQVVDNIQAELSETENQNKSLINEVKKLEGTIDDKKKEIESKHYREADSILDKLKEVQKEKEQLEKELENIEDDEETSTKKVRLGELKKQERIYSKQISKANVQYKIDEELNRETKQIQETINAKKAQISENERYIKSLEKELNLQKEKRKIEEPTKDELELQKKDLISSRDLKNKKYTEKINKINEETAEIQASIEETDKTGVSTIEGIIKEIDDLNQKVDEAEKKLEGLKNNKIKFSEVFNGSQIYQDYESMQYKYNEKWNVANKKETELVSRNNNIDKKLNEFSESYKDEIREQNSIVKSLEKQLQIEKSKKEVNKEKIEELQKKLILEQNIKKQLESQYSVEKEMEKSFSAHKIKDLSENIKLIQPLARGGHSEAQKDLVNYIIELEKLSSTTGLSFGKITTSIAENGKEIKTVVFDLKEIDKIIKSHPNAVSDYNNYQEYIKEKEENNKELSSIQYPDKNKNESVRKEYSQKLFEAFKQEQELYNAEWGKTGEITEEVEEHLFNMQRYMLEFGKVSGEFKKDQLDVLKNFKIQDNPEIMQKFGLNEDDIYRMFEAVQDTTVRNKNISNSSQSIEKQIAEQESIIQKAKNQIALKEEMLSKDFSSNLKTELAIKQRELEVTKENWQIEKSINRHKIKEIKRKGSNKKQDPKKIINYENLDSIKSENEYTDKDIAFETEAVEKKVEALEKEIQTQEQLNEVEKENLTNILEDSKKQYMDTNAVSQDNNEALKEMGILTDENKKSVNELFLEFVKGITSIDKVVEKMLQLKSISNEIDIPKTNIENQESILENAKLELSSYIKANKVGDIKANPDALLSKYNAYMNAGGSLEAFAQISKSKKSLISFVQNLQNAEIQAKEASNAVIEIAEAEKKIAATSTTSTSTVVRDIDKIIDAINRLIISLDRVSGVVPTEVLDKYWQEALDEYSKLQTKTGKFSMAKSVDSTAFNEAMMKYINAGGVNTLDMLPGAEGKLIDEKSLVNVTEKFEEFKATQKDVQGIVTDTTNVIQQQAKALGQVSIAEGSYVNIAGSVKVDEEQFGSLSGDFTELQDVSYKLLEVVRQIYNTIANGATAAIKNISAVETPVESITNQFEEINEQIDKTEVKLSKFGDRLKVVSGGDIDVTKYTAINEAVSSMNEAIAKDKSGLLEQIKKSGDITAKYVKSGKNDDKDQSEKVILDAAFKDTNGKIVKLRYTYDVLEKTMTDASGVTRQMADNLTMQEKAARKADAQLTYYTSKLDKIKVKYEMFNINDFMLDDDNNLVAKAGTNAEEIYHIITGKTRDLVKNVIIEMKKVDDKFKDFKEKSESGTLSQGQFDNLSSELNLSIEKLDNAMNAVNRRINSQMEHTSRNWMAGFQRDLSNAQAALYDSDGSVRIDETGLNTQGLDYLKKYKDAVFDLQEMYVTLKDQGENFTQDQITSWKKQMQTITDFKKILNSNSSKKYVNGSGFSQDNLSINEDQFSNLIKDSTYARQLLGSLAQAINNTDIEIIKLSKDNQTLTYTYKDQNKNIQMCKLSVSDFGKTIRNTNVDSTKHVSLLSRAFGTLKDKILQVIKYTSAYEIFYKVVNSIKQGVEVTRDFDKALTEMRKVSDESVNSLKNFQKESFNIANSVGATAIQIQNSTADFMRLGESIEEAKKSAKTANILLNVSEFESIEDATESLVAMSAAYSELEKQDIVDKLNEVGNNYSISSDGIATALQDSASALKTASNDMDEAIALVTAGNAVVQDPNSVGSGLRTIALRLTGTKAAKEELESLGEDTEGVITTVSKLRDTIMSATKVTSNGFKGFDILDENGNYKSTYEIMKGLSEVYQEIVETDKKNGTNNINLLLETIAGKNRANIAASILQNNQLLEDAYNSSANESQGSAQEELDKYLDSIEGKIAQFQNRVQELWYNLLDSEIVKQAVDSGTKLINVLSNVLSGITESPALNIITDVLTGIVDLLDTITSKAGKLSTVLASVAGISLYNKFKDKDNNSGGRVKQRYLNI